MRTLTLAKSIKEIIKRLPKQDQRYIKQRATQLNIEDCESLDETAYLLHSRKNALRLKQSIAEIESGKALTKRTKVPD